MMKGSPKWTMTSRNFYTHQEITPGPGAYPMSSTLSGPNFRLGKSIREPLAKSTINPGPGSYHPTKPLPFQGNTLYFLYSFPTSQRKEITVNVYVPGPGQYYSVSKQEGPHYSLRGRVRSQSQESKPVPGNYNPSYDYTLEKTPAFKLGTSKRNTIETETCAPGPGNYSFRNTLAGPN